MGKLGIYGAGGLGREVCILAEKINYGTSRWNEIFFIDDVIKNGVIRNKRILPFNEAIEVFDDFEVVIAQGEPKNRELLYDKVKKAGCKMATLIYPDVYIDYTTCIGEGTVICAGAAITADVCIGVNSYIQPNAVIGHDIKIGNHCIIGSLAHIGGKSVLGNRVFMGFSSSMSNDLCIGDDVIISGGSSVFKNLEDRDIAVGNPARVSKKNDEGKVFK